MVKARRAKAAMATIDLKLGMVCCLRSYKLKEVGGSFRGEASRFF